MIEAPYLTLVATSRNDDHGGNTLYRTQIFVDSFLEQCERHQLRAELILVEWNPPADRASLAEIVSWGRQNTWVDCRVITVPRERHLLLRFARVLPLFQMIAKNAGIRRAKGEFILATNIDILFSDELMARVAQKNFRSDRLYRCDRFDVDSTIPKDAPIEEKLRFAWKNLVRRNYRSLATPPAEGAPPDVVIDAALASGHFELEMDGGLSALVAKASIPLHYLHLNACGDFTLLHRDAWAQIGGYPEFEIFSLHLDSLGAATAHLSGFRETWLTPPAVCFHIEHAIGSGYTAENQAPMFERIERQGIGWFEFDVIAALFDEMREKGAPKFNTDAWGLRDIPLDETVCTRQRKEERRVPEASLADRYAPVTAIRPEYNTDRPLRTALRRAYEQRARYEARAEEAEALAGKTEIWANEAVSRAEKAETWAKEAVTRAEASEAWAQRAEEWAKKTDVRAEAAEARAERAEARTKETEAQLELFRADNERKTRLLEKYQRLFGWLEKFPPFK
jgi:hypothetical protein